MNLDLSKGEFRGALRLRCDLPIPDSPSVCVCGCSVTVDQAMICQRGGPIIRRHNEIRDLEAELLDMICYDVAIVSWRARENPVYAFGWRLTELFQ